MNIILLGTATIEIGVITNEMLTHGQTLTSIRDNKAYLGQADSFSEYLSQQDVRSHARKCMELYDFYCIKHTLHIEDIHDIHHERLLEAIKAIKLHPGQLEYWLTECRTSSWKDLINKIREARGKSPMPFKASDSEDLLPPGSPYKTYREYVKNQRCILEPYLRDCLGSPVEYAHYPRTKVRGKFAIPLCHNCHQYYQELISEEEFMKNHKEALDNYWSNLVKYCFGGIE